MKKIPYIVVFTLVWLSSCQVLEEDPKSFISPENFYKTKSDAVAALTAAYNPIQTNGTTTRNYVLLGDIPTDNMFPLPINNDRVQLDQFTYTPQNSVIRETWQNFYVGITRCNIVIDRIPLINMDETLRNRYVAEAKFLRAFYYYQLVRLFGDIPLVTKEVANLSQVTAPTHDAKEKVYQQIMADLKDAETVLPIAYTGSDRGRATRGAAKAFLASVYLTLKQYQQAADKAAEVMAPDMGYGLWDTYLDVYDIKNEFGKEAIFDVQFISGPFGQASNLIAFFAQENSAVAGRGFGSFQPTQELYDSFDPTDLRRPVFFTKGTDNKYYCNKWVDIDALTDTQSDNNYPLMRYAEVVLIFAEASNAAKGPTDEAYAAVNKIRKRAGLPDLSGLTKEELNEAILKERRLELCFEGQRWFDLVRTGRLVSELKPKGSTNVQEYHSLFPIPQFEIDLNQNLKPQNTGYPQ